MVDQGPNQASGNEPAQQVIVAIRSSVSKHQRVIGGKRVVVLHDDERGKFFHLGSEESIAASMLDGTAELTEISAELNRMGIAWSFEELSAFVTTLVKADLASVINLDGQPMSAINTRNAPRPRSLPQVAGVVMSRLLSQRFPLGNADSLAARLLPSVGLLYARTGFCVWLPAVGIALWLALDHTAEIKQQCEQMFAPESWLLLACVGILIKVVHELGHAIAAKRHGVRVGSVGVTLFLLAPLAFVDLTNAWKVTSRWARIQIALGGVYLESWLAVVATLMFTWLDDGLPRHVATQVMLIAGPATWLINANPLLRLDGYYALADAVDIPNLRMHGRQRWASLIDHWLLGTSIEVGHLIGWRKHFAMCHAAASVVFQAIWMTGIIVAVSAWTGSIGLLLAIVATLAWVAAPVANWWLRHWNTDSADLMKTKQTRRRMVALAGSLGLMVSSVLSSRNPFSHGVPVLVQHRDEQVGRAASAGFVTAVEVRSNQLVRRGDLLAEVTDDQLVLRRQQMSDELLLNVAKYRQLQSAGKLADAEAANETAKQLRSSIAELDQSLAASRIVAMRDGMVVSEQPERWLGRYAKCGDILVRVADPNDKELLVAIQENEFSTYNKAVDRGTPLTARIRSGGVLSVDPNAAQPRFNHMLPHPAMATTSGGDITVVPDPESPEGVKPAIPIGIANASISPVQSRGLRVGQHGTLYLTDDQTVYARLKQLIVGSL